MHVHESCFVLDKPLRAILKFQSTVVFDPKLGVSFEHQPSTTQGHFAACLDDKFTPGWTRNVPPVSTVNPVPAEIFSTLEEEGAPT